ncbi:MAG TPA: ABC transporter substrate-binding protein [Actinomycetota bacterium]
MHRIVALLLLAAACAPASGSDPLVVGAVYPTAGSQGIGGIEEFRGVRLAVERINAEGGVNGRLVRLSVQPAESAEGAPLAVRAAAADGAEVILGSYGSTISTKAAKVASDLDLVFWETGAVGEIEDGVRAGERFFRLVSMGGSLGDEGVRFLDEQLLPMMGEDPRTLDWGVLYVDDVYGRSVGLGAAETIEEAGLPLAGTFPYDLATLDGERLVRRIGRAGVDVLVVSAYLEDGVELRKEMVRQGLPLVASVGTSSSYCMREFAAALGEDAVGLFASDKPNGEVMEAADLRPDAAGALEWANREYERRWDEPMPVPALSGFSGAWALFRHVLPGTGSATAEEVAEAALAADLPLGSLPNGSGLRFAPGGDPRAGVNLRATSVIWEWVDEQEREVVWPPDLATSPIVPIPIA